MCDEARFNYSKPAVQKKSAETESEKAESRLRLDDNLDGYINRKMSEDKEYIRKLDEYGLSKIPQGALK